MPLARRGLTAGWQAAETVGCGPGWGDVGKSRCADGQPARLECFPPNFRRHQCKKFLFLVNKSPKPRAHTGKAKGSSGVLFLLPQKTVQYVPPLKTGSDILPLNHIAWRKAERCDFGKWVPPTELWGTGAFPFLLFPSLHYYFLFPQPP